MLYFTLVSCKVNIWNDNNIRLNRKQHTKHLCLMCWYVQRRCTVSRNLPALSLGGQTTRAVPTQRRTAHRGATVSISAGVYLQFHRTRRTKWANAVGMSFALFVVCSFWKALWKLADTLRAVLVRSVRWKNEIPSDLQKQAEKCGQKLYTWRFTSHNIYGRENYFSPALSFAKMLTCYQTFWKVVSALFAPLAFC